MTNILVGAFLVLHGLVHLLYLGQSLRCFELQPGMTWPDVSWAFSKLLGLERTRTLAAICCALAASGFAAAGAALLAGGCPHIGDILRCALSPLLEWAPAAPGPPGRCGCADQRRHPGVGAHPAMIPPQRWSPIYRSIA